MIRFFLISITLGLSALCYSQETSGSHLFWEQLKKHCDKTYEGQIIEGVGNPLFDNKKLLMHVRECSDSIIRIPFYVGDNYSRTWVLTFKDGLITLKHDHRKPSGADDEVTQYGGTASNAGSANLQIFPADEYTSNLLSYTIVNVWWLCLDDDSFTYNLSKIGSKNTFSVKFNLKQSVPTPPAPWGSK